MPALSSFACSGSTFLMNLAGTPPHSSPSPTCVPFSTKAPAATIAPSPITASSSTVAPIPMSAPLFTVQPCSVTLCPMVTSSPISMAAFLYNVCRHDPSCMFTRLPILMQFTSPRTIALNHTVHWSPICTSPTIVAFSLK